MTVSARVSGTWKPVINFLLPGSYSVETLPPIYGVCYGNVRCIIIRFHSLTVATQTSLRTRLFCCVVSLLMFSNMKNKDQKGY